MFDEKREFTLYKELQFKVTRFAMDKVRLNTLKSLDENFISKGTNCDCWDRIVYKLPCPCMIAEHQDVLPLGLIDRRWRIEVGEIEGDNEEGKSIFLKAFLRGHL